MKLFVVYLVSLFVTASSFSCESQHRQQQRFHHVVLFQTSKREEFDAHTSTTRSRFLTQAVITSVAASTGPIFLFQEPALARGRATLEFAYDKYTPRIMAGGSFYKSQLKNMIAGNDFAGIKSALAEPPKKSKEDRAKVDGGVTERASQAGQFSDSRVIVAMDLFASQFSDNSISPKTKAMKKEVDELRSIVQTMDSLAKQALGEESAGGGFFGLGKKQPNKSEISQKMKELYIEGGTAWNRYVFAANDGLPVTFNKLPYL